MPKTLLLALALVTTGGLAFAKTAGREAPAAGSHCYLFTYFVGNGQDGLHLMLSPDGYHWRALGGGRSYLRPEVGREKLIRDPCVVRGPEGVFHMVWTCGWWENGIGYASTRDFIHWSKQREIPVMAAEPGVRNCWAPEIDYDAKRDDYLIFWASTVRGRFPKTAGSSENDLNHRIYCTTTKDFVNYTPTRLFYNPGFSVIDATILPARGRYFLIVKDETRTPPKKYLRIASSDDLEGPYAYLGPTFTPKGLWVEGPTAIRIGNWYLVYFDAYIARHYGAMRSRDLKTWQDVTDRMTFPGAGTPERVRHGTIIELPSQVVTRLIEAAQP